MEQKACTLKKAISQEEPQVWKCCDISYVARALYAA